VRDLDDALKVRHAVPRVPDALQIHGLGLVVDQFLELLGAVRLRELGRYAETGQHDFQLVVGAAVEVVRGDDVVSDARERGATMSPLAFGIPLRSALDVFPTDIVMN